MSFSSNSGSLTDEARARLAESIDERLDFTRQLFERRKTELGVKDRWFLSRDDVEAVNVAGITWFQQEVTRMSPVQWRVRLFRLPTDQSKKIVSLDVEFTA